MKKAFIVFAAAAVALGSVSCKKEVEENDLRNRPVRFSANMESFGDEKTELRGRILYWSDGDQVAVLGEGLANAVAYQVEEGGDWRAKFVYAGDGEEPEFEAPFKAGYPAEYWGGDLASITLPSHQSYVANSMEKFPMYGETDETTVSFKNVCGVLRMRLQKESESITKIVVTTDTYLNGVFGVAFENDVPSLTHASMGTNGDTLYCDTPVDISSSTDFYIYLPAGSYNPMRIEVFNTRGLMCTLNANHAIAIERNKISTVTLPASSLRFSSVSGLISVSETTQVRFATGNLRYDRGTEEFYFADNQYDVLATRSASASVIDLFYFSQGELNNYGVNSLPGGSSQYSSDNYVDWGQALSSGGNNSWRTISIDEWCYATCPASGTRSNSKRRNKWGYAIIDGIHHGMVILPDEWQAPSGVTFRPWSGTATLTTTGWGYSDVNNYTNAEWLKIEESGAVFIPGYGTSYNAYYWTPSPANVSNPSNPQYYRYNMKNHDPSSNPVQSGIPVRLAQNYEPLVIVSE